MSRLAIAPGLALDPDYVGGGTFALLAKKGAGKTYLGRVMAEEFWRAKVPFVALDPMDAWWGLRSSADGQGEGIPVAIFGGPHGDAPLEDTSGKLMADLAVDDRLSMVLSLKHFGTRSAERRFAHDFLERLYRRNSELVHLLIDEADLFAPQKPASGDQPLLGITENIIRRGRNSGIGATLITQRPAVLNKDVLTQVDGLVAMRIVGLQDRHAIDEWVKGHGDPETAAEVKGTLAGLANGECWWWVPELGVLERVQVREGKTFDSSPTRRRSETRAEPKSFADVDMDAIAGKMQESIERARENDPAELRKKIRQLERDIEQERRLAAKGPTAVETIEVPIEIPAISDKQLERLEQIIAKLARDLDTVGNVATALGAVSEGLRIDVIEALRKTSGTRGSLTAEGPRRQPRSHQPAPAASHARRPAHASAPSSPAAHFDGDVKLGKGELKILGVLAEYPEGRTINELAFLAGYSAKASTIGVILSNLRKAGYVEPGNQPVRPTHEGLDAVGGPVERPTGDALLQQWLQHSRMGKGEREVLLALLDLYPEEPSHEELCEITGYSPIASTMGVILSSLRKLDLVEKGRRRLADEFVEAVES